jgi:anti-anti-sigma regulatory factor
MVMIPGWLSIDERCVGPALQDAVEKLDGTGGEAVVNFSAVWRLDPTALRAMEEFVGVADEKGVKVVLRGVSVDVYKVLKLTKLASRFRSRAERDRSAGACLTWNYLQRKRQVCPSGACSVRQRDIRMPQSDTFLDPLIRKTTLTY